MTVFFGLVYDDGKRFVSFFSPVVVAFLLGWALALDRVSTRSFRLPEKFALDENLLYFLSRVPKRPMPIVSKNANLTVSVRRNFAFRSRA